MDAKRGAYAWKPNDPVSWTVADLEAWQLKRGLSNEQLASVLQVTKSTVYTWRRPPGQAGARTMPAWVEAYCWAWDRGWRPAGWVVPINLSDTLTRSD